MLATQVDLFVTHSEGDLASSAVEVVVGMTVGSGVDSISSYLGNS